MLQVPGEVCMLTILGVSAPNPILPSTAPSLYVSPSPLLVL